MRFVIDTNILVAALRSNLGSAYKLLSQLHSIEAQVIVSTPLVLEYEDVLTRPGLIPGITREDAGDVIDYLVSISVECRVHFLWRPFLPDPKDDMVLELALAGGAEYIISFNKRDFPNVEEPGVRVLSPSEFLNLLAIL
jgi:putative PIN family toxin of toxin-antitoxin system